MARQKFVIEKVTEDCQGTGAVKQITAILTPVTPVTPETDEALALDKIGSSTAITLTADNPDSATSTPLVPGDEVYITLTPVP